MENENKLIEQFDEATSFQVYNTSTNCSTNYHQNDHNGNCTVLKYDNKDMYNQVRKHEKIALPADSMQLDVGTIVIDSKNSSDLDATQNYTKPFKKQRKRLKSSTTSFESDPSEPFKCISASCTETVIKIEKLENGIIKKTTKHYDIDEIS